MAESLRITLVSATLAKLTKKSISSNFGRFGDRIFLGETKEREDNQGTGEQEDKLFQTIDNHFGEPRGTIFSLGTVGDGRFLGQEKN